MSIVGKSIIGDYGVHQSDVRFFYGDDELVMG